MNLAQSAFAFRLARRSAVRRRVRAALIVALIAAPIAAMTVIAIGMRTTHVTEAQAQRWRRGRAGALYVVPNASPEQRTARVAALLAALPAGTHALTLVDATLDLRHAGEVTTVELRARPATDKLYAVPLRVVRGRAASAAGEVALSGHALRDLHARVGDAVVGAGVTWRVVGQIQDPWQYESFAGQVAPGQLDAVPVATLASVATDSRALVDLPPGIGVSDGAVRTPQPDDSAAAYFSGALLLFAAAIIGSTAFAVSTRRHLRELGILGAAGATPGQLVWMQSVEGVVLGVVAGVLGAALGTVLAVATYPLFDSFVSHDVGPLRLSPADWVAALVLGVIGAAISAWLPARSIFTLTPLGALSGRRPPTKVPRALTGVGATLFALGIASVVVVAVNHFDDTKMAMAAFFVFGCVGTVLGLTMLTVRVVAALEPLSRRFPGLGRMGLRTVARERARSASVVAAVMAAGAIAIGVGAATLKAEEPFSPYHLATDEVLVQAYGRSGSGVANVPPDVIAHVHAVLPDERHVVLERPVPPALPGANSYRSWYPLSPELYVYGGTIVARPDVLTFMRVPPEARAALRRSHVVVLGVRPRARAVLGVNRRTGRRGEVIASKVDAEVVKTARAELVGLVFVDETVLAREGLEAEGAQLMFRTGRPLNPNQRDQIAAIARESAGQYADRTVYVDHFRGARTEARFRAALTVTALVFALVVVGLALALMEAEGRGERALLAAIGASRRAAARVRAMQAAALTLLGAALAVFVGWGGAWFTTNQAGHRLPTPLPVVPVTGVVVLLPLLAIAGVVLHALLAPSGRVTASILAEDD